MTMNDTSIDDAIKELQGGSVNAIEDLTVLALATTCTLERREQILTALYAVLDEAFLRSSKADSSHPVLQALCLASVAHINLQLPQGPEAQNALQMLKLHWATLLQWVYYLKSDFIDQASVDLPFRLLAKRCVGDFLGVCDDTFLGDSFDVTLASPGLITTLVSLWRLESQDKRFFVPESVGPSYLPIFYPAATLDSWMSAFCRRENWEWSEILRPFDDETNTLAVTALDHLSQDIARAPVNYDLIVWDIHLLTTLSINDTIRIPLLKHQSMTIVPGVMKSLVDQYATTDQHALIAKCLSYAYWYIRAYVESTEGLPWLTEAVDAGLLSVILLTEPWIKHLHNQDDEAWEPLFLLLTDIIPKYSVYGSALRAILKQLEQIDAAGLPKNLDKNGLLSGSWITFEEAIRCRAELLKLTFGDGPDMHSCQNSQCNKSGPPGSFKSCAGCLHVNYCSKECQVYDWKEGDHRKLCHEIQFRREYSLPLPLSTANIRFLDRLVAEDLRRLRGPIQETATTLDANPVVVELDYKEVPMVHEVGTIHTVSPITACNCDSALAQNWAHMHQLAVKATSTRILLRAFFSEGESERVKLQCLSLQRVLSDDFPSTEDDSMSDASETFNLLYSRIGTSGGVVDAAFPEEAIRSTEEKLSAEAVEP